ncbi:MAG: alpha/beta hydrolase [Nocardioides sp.]|nr:alpha/beta hydrolase [Nocardioides sp.]
MRLYVHGAGRAGREAWPEQPRADAVFADHSACSRMRDKAELVGGQCPDEDVVLVAHSLGAVPAALAFTNRDITASHVVLLEPALYDIARGHDAIERHVAPMTVARERAESGDLFGYWQIVGPMMFGREAARDSWHEDQDLARRFADLEPPWGHGIEESAFATVATMVVTGDWNDEYEAIAGRLTRAGAVHVTLPGAKHRPQDHPGFERLLVEFVSQERDAVTPPPGA